MCRACSGFVFVSIPARAVIRSFACFARNGGSMNRAACDNALLAACDELYGKLTRAAAVGLLGTAIGATWYLLVGLRAGA